MNQLLYLIVTEIFAVKHCIALQREGTVSQNKAFLSFLVQIVTAQLFSSSLDPKPIHKQGQLPDTSKQKIFALFSVAEAAGKLLRNSGNCYSCMLVQLRMMEISGVNTFIFLEKDWMCDFEKWIFVFISIKWHLSLVSEQTRDIGFVMETWHAPIVPYSSINSGKSLHISFPTHFISPKSGIPNSYINFIFLHSSFNLLILERI